MTQSYGRCVQFDIVFETDALITACARRSAHHRRCSAPLDHMRVQMPSVSEPAARPQLRERTRCCWLSCPAGAPDAGRFTGGCAGCSTWGAADVCCCCKTATMRSRTSIRRMYVRSRPSGPTLCWRKAQLEAMDWRRRESLGRIAGHPRTGILHPFSQKTSRSGRGRRVAYQAARCLEPSGAASISVGGRGEGGLRLRYMDASTLLRGAEH